MRGEPSEGAARGPAPRPLQRVPAAGLDRPGRRIPALDGVRGVAILLVLVYHFTLYGGISPETLADKVYYRLALVGWSGVDLFFVLSGFLITGILYDSKGGRHYFRNFYVRRVLRIFPLYYGVLAIFFLVVPRLQPASAACRALTRDQLWYWTYLVNVQIAVDYWPDCYALGHFWSLAIEEQFYLLWPLLVFLCRRRALIWICSGAIGGSLILRLVLVAYGEPTAAYTLMPSRADALAVGGLLALVGRGPRGLAIFASRQGSLVAGAGLLLAAIFVWRRGLSTEDPVVVTIGFTLLALLFGGLLSVALTASPAARLFSHPVLRFFGRYSYGLYVFHHPIALLLGDSAIAVDMWPRLAGSRIPAQAGFFAVATAISLAVAMASWHGYEAPLLKLKRYFRYHGG